MVVAKNILLVEDEPTLQRILGSVLGDAGHSVTAIGTAEQAVERLDDGADVDLVLTDKNLPKQSGLDLLHAVRAGEKNGRKLTGVILVTGYPSRDTALQALADDADGYLVKPFRSLSHAVDQIQRVLDADLVERRKGPPLARRVAAVLAGLPDDLSDVEVAVLGDLQLRGPLMAAKARLVDVERARVVVGADVKALAAVGAKGAGTGLVLVDAGASFQDVVEVIGGGGGAIVDGSLAGGKA